MKRRVVENWLTKAGEISFTIPFCQLLISEGIKVIHISSQGPLEQGKDIIAVDESGKVYCYQLKCGNINARVWAEIKPEIDQLVELPPRHPSLDETVDEWEAVLVTNGTIANPTARDIYDYSESKRSRGHQALKTIVGGELLDLFDSYYGDFFPIDTFGLQRFLALFNVNGDEELNLGDTKQFFERILREYDDASRQRRIEAIRASLILCRYMLTHQFSERNHLAVIQAHVLLLASIYEFADRHELNDTLWRSTEQLAYEALDVGYSELLDEIEHHPDTYVETRYGLLSEVVAYKIRCAELLGYISAYLNYQKIKQARDGERDLNGFFEAVSQHQVLLGEVFVPLYLNYIMMLESGQGDEDRGASQVVDMIVAYVAIYVDGGRGMPSPYYDFHTALNWSMLRKTDFEEDFAWRSYTVRSLILLAVRLGLRDELDSAWPTLSRITQQEVIPNEAWDYLNWRIAKGSHDDRFPDATQSWQQLVDEASADFSEELPTVLNERIHFLPLLINVMPHRLNHRIVLTIFNALEAADS